VRCTPITWRSRRTTEDVREADEPPAHHVPPPQLDGIAITHRWAGAIDTCSRFCAFFGLAHKGRIAYAAGFTGLGVGASRFAADVTLDLLAGTPTERTELAMVRERPIPFRPEPLASIGIRLAD
jgi:hypothetical protein